MEGARNLELWSFGVLLKVLSVDPKYSFLNSLSYVSGLLHSLLRGPGPLRTCFGEVTCFQELLSLRVSEWPTPEGGQVFSLPVEYSHLYIDQRRTSKREEKEQEQQGEKKSSLLAYEVI